jgi:hypothetical protein
LISSGAKLLKIWSHHYLSFQFAEVHPNKQVSISALGKALFFTSFATLIRQTIKPDSINPFIVNFLRLS